MSDRPTNLPHVGLSPLSVAGEVPDDVVAMVVEASFDAAILEHNYLPARMSPDAARAYCLGAVGVVLCHDGLPAGLAVAHPRPDPGEGVTIPPNAVELDVWVLRPYRGQVVRWFPLIKRWMSERFDHLIGVVWERHQTARALLRFAGFQTLGRSFWKGEGALAGHCEVFALDLRAHRGPPAEPSAPAPTEP